MTFVTPWQTKTQAAPRQLLLLSYYLSKALKTTTLLLSFTLLLLLIIFAKKKEEQEPTLSVCCWAEAFTFGVHFDPSNRSDSPFVFVHTIGCLSSSFSIFAMSLSFLIFSLSRMMSSGGLSIGSDSFCLSEFHSPFLFFKDLLVALLLRLLCNETELIKVDDWGRIRL